jgi:hypothetical protein
MTDDDKKPDPVEDLKAGLGLLFRAARGAVEKIPTHKIEEMVKEGTDKVGKAFHKVPTDKVEEVVKESATEIGRAMEHVAQALGHGIDEVTGAAKKKSEPPPADTTAPPAKDEAKSEQPPAGDSGEKKD